MDNLSIKELETLLEAVRVYGADRQQIKAVEELSELAQALCKYTGEDIDDAAEAQLLIDHIAEEMADVEIMLEQLRIILGNHARVDAWQHEKLARLAVRLERAK